jgi:DNA-directed RNA polymerase specialized sigma subunit
MSKQRVIVEAVLTGKSQGEVARLYGISQPRVSQRACQMKCVRGVA